MKNVRLWSAICGLIMVSQVGPSFAAQPAATDGGNSFYPAAVWYSGGKARAPMLEQIDNTSSVRWGSDLDKIKADGFNTVKTWIDWKSGEPKPSQFDFDNLNLLMRLAHERGLRVIIQIYLDSAPQWVGRLHPDGRFVDRSGAVIDSQSAPGYCLDNPGVQREALAFLKALSQDANRSPSLYGWDVWSEPHVINWAEFPYLSHPEFGFNPATQARFRDWLRKKYKNLDALNAAWYRTFTSWDEVEAPRFPTILSYTDYIDWRMFTDDKLAGDLAMRVNAIRTADTVHPITSHSDAPSLFTSPTNGYGEPDDFKMSASADFYGTSMYPMHSQSTHPWSRAMLDTALDFSRSAGHSFHKGFWIGELQAGQGATGMRIAAPVTPEDETFWMWQAVAHGAREFAIFSWYPMSSGFESNGYGLINLDGTLTDRARAAGKTAANISRHGSTLLNATPAPAQIAILYNRLSYMVGGSQPTLSTLGRAPIDSALGLHQAFAEEQLPVDFVSPQDVVSGRLGQYKILFVPFPVMLSSNVANGIKQFVENGGVAVGEARLAWNNERGFASPVIPGIGMDKVFGAREKLIRPSDKPQITLDPSANLSGMTGAGPVSGAAFEEDLEPYPGSRVLGRFEDGEPAVVENSAGKGKTVLIGSFMSLAYQQHPDTRTRQFLVSLAKIAGVSTEIEVSGAGKDEIQVRRLVSDQEQIVFGFNQSNQSVAANISLTVPWTTKHATDWGDDGSVPFQIQNGRLLLNKTFAPDEVWVVSLTAR